MISNYEIILRLVLALFLGALLGIERIRAGKNAGLRTFALVSMGSALFMIVSELVANRYGLMQSPTIRVDAVRIASGLVEGIGFLGAGMILFQKDHIANLTTAAGVWVSAAIGMSVGYGLYLPALTTTLLVVFTFTIMWNIEHKLKIFFGVKENKDFLKGKEVQRKRVE